MPARAQAELYEALLGASRALLGGNSDVGGKQWQQPTNLPFFFHPMSPLRDRRQRFCETVIRIRGRKVELPVHHS